MITDEQKRALIDEAMKTRCGRCTLMKAMASNFNIKEETDRLCDIDACYSLMEQFMQKVHAMSVISKDMVLEEYDQYWSENISKMRTELFVLLSSAMKVTFPATYKEAEDPETRFDMLDL